RAFLGHASARVLAAEAARQCDELRALVARKHDDDLRAARLFAASRFGFEQALRAWPASNEARAGLHATHAAMAEYELRRRHADAAAVLLQELQAFGDAPPALVTASRELSAELAREAAAAARLEQS